MSDSLPYEQCRELKTEADHLLKAQRYAEAALLYKQAYELCDDDFAASRYLHCSRKSGTMEARQAVRFAREVVLKFPENDYIKREGIWTIYDAYLKNANGHRDTPDDEEAHELEGENRELPSHDFRLMVKAARYILDHTYEDLPRRLAAFVMCNEAKRLKKWETVYTFAKELDPTTLSEEQKEWEGRRLPSDYQKWLNLINRSQLELGYYDECKAYAREAIEKFPNDNFYFYRRAALAQIRQGEIAAGVQQLEYINKRFPKQWYVQKEIAEAYMQLRQDETAWLWFCHAAYAQGDIKGRVLMLDSMCNLLQRIENWREMYEHLLLVWAIQIEFSNSQRIEQTRQRVLAWRNNHKEDFQGSSNVEPEPPAIHMALRPCRAAWEKTIRASRPPQRGRITHVNEEKRYGFIQSEAGVTAHFKFSAFRGQPAVGMQVEFESEESFDVKHSKTSVSAVFIRLVKP